MRIKHTIRLQIARDTAMRRLLFSDDEQLAEKIIDNYQRHTQGHLSIAAGATESLSLGDVTSVKGMYLELDQDAYVRLNGSLDNIVMAKPPGASEDTAKLFLESTITAVEIENPTSSTLTGIYVMWGDATA